MATFEVMSNPQRREAGLPHYVNTQNGEGPWEPPFLFCNHHHATFAEAEKCQDFGRADDTTD
jgi:hypothetical protein